MARKQWISGLVGVGMLAFLAASCDNADDAIAPDEARAVARAILGASQAVYSQPDGLAAAGADVEVREYDITADCPDGGTVTMKGTIEEDKEAGTMKQDGTITYDNCDVGEITVVEGRLSDVLIVVSGHDMATWDGSWAGNVFVESDDGGSGECEVDLTAKLTFKVDPNTKNIVAWDGHMTGTICGVSVHENMQGGTD